MKRRIYNVLAGLSLLLCMATVGMWVRSYWVADTVEWGEWTPSPDGPIGVQVDWHATRGLIVMVRTWDVFVPDPSTIRYEMRPLRPTSPSWRHLGFGKIFGWEDFSGFYFPIWALTLGATFLPALQFCRLRRRHEHGCCTICGYDLRATPDRCPECGTSVAGKSKV